MRAAHQTSGAGPADAVSCAIESGMLVDGKDSFVHLVAGAVEILVSIAMNLYLIDLDQRLMTSTTGKSMMCAPSPCFVLAKRDSRHAQARNSRRWIRRVVTAWFSGRLPLPEQLWAAFLDRDQHPAVVESVGLVVIEFPIFIHALDVNDVDESGNSRDPVFLAEHISKQHARKVVPQRQRSYFVG